MSGPDVKLPAELRGLDALLFDLDGVVTRTAALHAEAWKRLFDELLAGREARGESPLPPFDAVEDYRAHVDGRPGKTASASSSPPAGSCSPRAIRRTVPAGTPSTASRGERTSTSRSSS